MESFKKRVSDYTERRLGGTVFSGKEIIRMLIPFILDSLSIFLINMLITALISGNGEQSVAAVALVGPILSLVTCMFNGIGSGGTVVVAQSCGKNDDAIVRRASVMVIWPTVGVGLVACIPMLIFASPVLRLLYPSAEAVVLTKATTYLRGVVISVMPFTVYTAVFAVLRGMGESKKCLALSVIINVAYLLFSILFLNVLNLDIRGTVIALILARVTGMLAAVFLLMRLRKGLRPGLHDLGVFDKDLFMQTLRVSIPMSLEQIFASCGGIVSEIYMAMLGTAALAANSIANSLMGMLQVASYAASSLAVTVAGRCFGAGKPKEARRYAYRSIVLGMGVFVLMACVFYPFLPQILRIYKPTETTAKTALFLLYLSAPMLLIFFTPANVMPSALRSIGDNVFPSAFSLIALWAINIFGGWVLAIPAGLGLTGVWISNWAGWIIRASGYCLRFESVSKRAILKASVHANE